MPDIRDVLKALQVEDARLYSQVRTDMRRSYMAAHAANLRLNEWTAEDDQVLDLIDIQVAMLFVRSGKFDLEKGHVDIDGKQQIEAQIKAKSEELSKLQELAGKGQSDSQKILATYEPKPNNGSWPTGEQQPAK